MMTKFQKGDIVVYLHVGGFEAGIVDEVEDDIDEQDENYYIRYTNQEGKKRINTESVLWTEEEIQKEFQMFSDIVNQMKVMK